MKLKGINMLFCFPCERVALFDHLEEYIYIISEIQTSFSIKQLMKNKFALIIIY